MKTPAKLISKICFLLWVTLLHTQRTLGEEPSAAALEEFRSYSKTVESRLVQQHRTAEAFLAPPGAARAHERLRQGEVILERLSPAQTVPTGAMVHHWRGSAFAPGAAAADFETLMRDFRVYPQRFGPEVVQAKAIASNGDAMQAWMRVRQHHVLTVVLDTTYDVRFGRLDRSHGYSISHSTRIDEIGSAGTSAEHVLSAEEEHGFLWRLNTYWSYEERDGGLYLQVEAVSLTRAVPSGLGWAIRPYVESIPRESLEFTLRSACRALGK